MCFFVKKQTIFQNTLAKNAYIIYNIHYECIFINKCHGVEKIVNILLVVNEQKDPDCILANKVVQYMGDRATIYVNNSSVKQKIDTALYVDREEGYQNADIILVLGGDGTMLSIAGKAAEYAIPVIGVNLGRLGFLADIECNEIEESIRKLFSGEYVVEERMMLEAVLPGGIKTTAINDIVITRANSFLKILELDVYIDDEYVDDFKADGIIISTPTGSTAYSLSAGGPIVDPSLDSMIVTPICPHKMYCRTIIAPPDKTITIKCKATSRDDAVVAADSQISGKLSADENVFVKASPKSLKLIRLKGTQFFGALQKKLIKKES